jgi:oxygen-dependent protoporphyrinogen oxidase
MRPRPRVIVIGAGLAGLAAARVLEQRAVDAVVVEEEDRPGGRLRSFRRDGDNIEMGAQFIHSNYERTLALCKVLDLEGDLVEMKNADALVRGGKLHLVPWGGRRMPAVSLWSHVRLTRLLPALLRNRRALALERWPDLLHLDGAELADYARSKLGEEALDYVVRPLMLTYSMAEPEGLSVAYFLRSLSMYLTTGAHCFRSGNETLPKALARGLDVRCGTRAEALLVDGHERVTGVRTSAGDLEASAVISAVPSPVLQGLYSGWTSEQEAFLSGFRYSGLPLVLLEADMPEPPPIWGIVLDRRAGHRVSFVTYPHGKYPGASAPRYLQAWPMGSFGAELLARTDEEIADAVTRELRDVTCLQVAALKPAAVIRYPYAFPQYRVGLFAKALRFQASEGRPRGLYLAGDYTEGGLIEGAVRSGERAAERVIDALA